MLEEELVRVRVCMCACVCVCVCERERERERHTHAYLPELLRGPVRDDVELAKRRAVCIQRLVACGGSSVRVMVERKRARERGLV